MSFLLEGRNRVTAGLPSLSPDFREAVDSFAAQRAKIQALEADKVARAQQAVSPDGSHPTTLLDAQIGRPMMSTDIIKRLQKLNSNLIFERSIACPAIMGIYLPDKSDEGRHHLFGFEAGISPEFSVRHIKENGEFKSETRGWRTVLARLIRSRLISGPAAEKAFGLPSRTSKNWQTLVT